jgi:DNA invertase Pin-like site-specific DNA recombinase
MKVALYARVSKANCQQDPELQLRDLRAWAQLNGHEVAEEYVDHGYSGSKASRPALDRLMRDVGKGLRDFDAIAVWKLDRFGRSLQHLVNAVAQLTEAQVAFVSLRDSLDLSTPAGKLMFHVMAAMAEFELGLIRERVKAGLRGDKPGYSRKGKKIGKPIGPDGPSRSTLWRQSKLAKP